MIPKGEHVVPRVVPHRAYLNVDNRQTFLRQAVKWQYLV